MNPNQQQYQSFTSGSGYRQPRSPRKRLLIIVTVILVFLAIVGVIYAATSGGGKKTPTTNSGASTSEAAGQKKNALNMMDAIKQYAKANNDSYPADGATLQLAMTDYAPDVEGYILQYKSRYVSTQLPTTATTMFYYTGYKCDNNVPVKANNSVAILYLNGTESYGCVNN